MWCRNVLGLKCLRSEVSVHPAQFADKPTRSQSSRGLVNLRTSQLADSDFLNHRKTTQCFYTELKSNPYTNPILLTGQFADEPTRGQSSRGLDNLQTSQLGDIKFFKIMELLYFFVH